MKYMVEFAVRTAGLSHDQNLANQEALLKAFGSWTPEEGLTIHAFVGNFNNGGYVLVEADDPSVVASFVSKFFAWNEIDVVPVVDITETVRINTAALAWAQNATRG